MKQEKECADSNAPALVGQVSCHFPFDLCYSATTFYIVITTSLSVTPLKQSNLTNISYSIARWPTLRWPWLLLALSASTLVSYALYTQHGPQQLWPCVQCIYQRTAMISVALFAWFGFFIATRSALARWIALSGWLLSALAGAYSAYYHSWIQSAINPLFAPCQPHPDFPSWAPLHQWVPQVFDAGGMCGDIDWQWLGLSMPQWLFIIFTTFTVLALIVIAARLLSAARSKR
ncbi:disulfide bond formation protein B [Aliidiomarina soli]|uniref:Disulfide bond formation protein B n=1 Tax=Aliidiomarina soli TaxID=1928574 RepID=A0A432WH50_9GAMM|nr:disulfide bond formation protein B [Aliidiomarina soli]